jgi:ribonucleotide monophosphatase NagD (HAD superfamily)
MNTHPATRRTLHPIIIGHKTQRFNVCVHVWVGEWMGAQVGDRLDTDIVFGNSNGAISCLVFSGVTTPEKYMGPDNKIKANYYCNSIADFFD